MNKHSRSHDRSGRILSLISLSGLGFSGWMILILSVAIITFLGSMIISPRRTYQVETPSDTVTLQILNGCGAKGAAETLANALLPGDGSLLYDVIEKTDARLGAFDRTLIVDRRGSVVSPGEFSAKALKVAERMGIEDDEIVLLRLEDNILNIDVTVIAGTDYGRYVERLNRAKQEPL